MFSPGFDGEDCRKPLCPLLITLVFVEHPTPFQLFYAVLHNGVTRIPHPVRCACIVVHARFGRGGQAQALCPQ